MLNEMVCSLIGQLNLALFISQTGNDDFVHIPREDVVELIFCLEKLREHIEEGVISDQ